MDDPIIALIVEWITFGGKYAFFIAIISYLVNMLLKAARGKSVFM